MRVIDLTGQRFERLKVLHRVENDKHGGARWLCICECGKEVTATTYKLRIGAVKSCGCYNHDCTRKRNKENARHNTSRTRLYREWVMMKQRCYSHKHKSYADYGGRGIRMCDDWLIPDNFFNWAMANGYSDELTIDRINNEGNYEPSNCRFVSMKEQIRNRRNTVWVEYQGEMLTLAELAEKCNIPYATIHWRYKNGFSIEQITKPVRKYKKG